MTERTERENLERRHNEAKLVFVMVGLPARGKTFIARKVARYLSWLGHKTRVFNVGAYRRERLGSRQPHSFFDPANEAGNVARLEMATAALDDMLGWLRTTAARSASTTRPTARASGAPSCAIAASRRATPVVFVESICNDPAIVEANVRETKLRSPDYEGIPPDEAVRDFRLRIAHYERVYEDGRRRRGELHQDHRRRAQGGRAPHRGLPPGAPRLLPHQPPHPPAAHLAHPPRRERVQRAGRIGGDAPLSARGEAYASALAGFVREEPAGARRARRVDEHAAPHHRDGATSSGGRTGRGARSTRSTPASATG